MQEITHSIRALLIRYTLWTHLTVILLTSFAFMQLSHLLAIHHFLGWILGLSLLSIPALTFVVIRDLSDSPSGYKYWLSWLIVFVLYPGFLFLTQFGIKDVPFLNYLLWEFAEGEIEFSVLSVLYVILELLLYFVSRGDRTNRSFSWIRGVSVFRLTVIVAGLFVIFIITLSNYFTEYVDNKSWFFTISYFIWCAIQLFIIYISYYIYYYIHHHILYDGVLKKRGFIEYLLGLVLVILILTPVQNYVISFFPVVTELRLHSMGLDTKVFSSFNYGLSILVLILTFPLIVIIEWYKQVNSLNELEKQKSKSELELLKQQINPHFFFNTLNNLYAMSLTQDKETPDTILQLSELMRYVIYKGKEEKVKLIDEIKYIKDYVDLQLIRLHKKVDYRFEEHIENESVAIPPLLFIILVENAFKHGIEPAEYNGFLHMEIVQKEHQLTFVCHNSKEENDSDERSGIGISNLKKRLDIMYPDQYTLDLLEEHTDFRATLNITL